MTTMVRLALLVAIIVTIALANGPDRRQKIVDHLKDITKSDVIAKTWEQYKTQFGKSYETYESEIDHLHAFLHSHEVIRRHQNKFRKGKVNFTLGWTSLSDWTEEEKLILATCEPKDHCPLTSSQTTAFQPPLSTEVPESIDWREKGFVTPVKDQNPCGSCWAFAAIGSLEGQYKRAGNALTRFSEQELMDCSRPDINGLTDKCKRGGFPVKGLEYIKKRSGIATEEAYPYAKQGQECQTDKTVKTNIVTKNIVLVKQDEEELKIAVATQGPVGVAVSVFPRDEWTNYNGTYVFDNADCKSAPMSHGVLVVGYGVDPKQGEYWLIKNSWGEGWGDKGYMKLARNKNKMCRITEWDSFYPEL